MQVADVDANAPGSFARAHAIVFGTPTYMRRSSADFERFAGSTSKAGKSKIACGFTNSDSLMGDTHVTLRCCCNLTVQHSMIRVGKGLPPSSGISSPCSDLDQSGSDVGATARSEVVEVPDLAAWPADLDTAYGYGRRTARIALRLRGSSSPNLVAVGNGMSLARENPSSTHCASG